MIYFRVGKRYNEDINRKGRGHFMKNRRTFIFVLAVLCIFCVAFSGCTSESSENQPVTISIWHVYGGQTDSPLNDLIDEFNETVGMEKGIQVEVTMVSNNKNIHNDILAAANSDPGAPELPDIFVAYPSTVMAMPDENILVDYRDYFSMDEIAGFIPSFVEDGEVNGRLVCLPVAKSTELLFINKTVFDRFSAETGADIESLSTWEGLYETAEIYAEWSDGKTPDTANDGKAFFVHDFHFNYFQVGVESLGEDFFSGDEIAFCPTFEKVWEPYARACLSGGVWLYGGYATEPLRTGEAVVSVASSASVLYFSNEVIYPDNTSEFVELVVRPCPTFKDGTNLVMQRGAGMCTVKSTPEREEAAVTFLRWLTGPEVNTRFAVSTGYMPVTHEAFENHLPGAISGLNEQKYIELYNAYLETREKFEFYSAPKFEAYLETENLFEDGVRHFLLNGRHKLIAGEVTEETLSDAVEENYILFKEYM